MRFPRGPAVSAAPREFAVVKTPKNQRQGENAKRRRTKS